MEDTESDRREFPRLKGAFQVRFGVCGAHGQQVPGFTKDMGIGGIRFSVPETDARLGDHLAVEIAVPGHDQPLYFLGEVVHLTETEQGKELGLRFDFLGKSDNYKALLADLLEAHATA